MDWSAQQYSAFERERTRPVRDLLAALPEYDVRRAVDLGCGPGNSTEILAKQFPNATITGLDSSNDMIKSARKRLPEIRFDLADIQTWSPSESFDVILANASLQWVSNHAVLYPSLVNKLATGGFLAIQTPDNLAEPAHVLARDLALDPAWVSQMGDVTHPERHSASWYYELLQPYCRQIDVWRTTYYHALANAAAIVEWFKGTALRPYLARLTEAEQVDFLAQYQMLIEKAYPELPQGGVLLPFPRLFIVAQR